MKILQVMAGGRRGGAETAFVDMCRAQNERPDLDVQVITRPNDVRVPKLRDAGMTVHTAPFGGCIDVYTPYKINKIIKKFQPDIVQSWMSRAPSKIKQWHAGMGAQRYVHVGRLGSPYKLKYFKSCDAFTAITPELQTYIQDQNIVPHDHVRHINNFADVDVMHAPINRSDYGVPEDAVLLLGLGRLHRDKAFDVLIKAMADLPDNIYLWIAGEGPARAKFEALIKDLGLEKRVTLLGWQCDRAALFAQADICTFISRDEGFGTVFVQSWALETPVIVSDADGPRQFVRDGEDGLVVPREDIPATVQAIKTLAADQALQKIFIQNGKARYQGEFTKDSSVNAYVDFYRFLRKEKAD